MKGWKRNLYVLCAAEFLTLIGFSSYLSFIAYYIQDLTGMGDAQALSWTAGFQAIGALAMMIASPIWGNLADRFGRKPMMIRATVSAAAIVALMGFVRSPAQIMVLRVAQGLLCGTVSAAMTIVATGTPEHSLGKSLGTLQMTMFAANAVGPLLGGIAADAFGYRAVFPISSGLMVISTLAIILYVRETKDPAQAKPAAAEDKPSVRVALRQLVRADVLVLVAAMGGTYFANNVLAPVVPLFIKGLAGSTDRLATMAGSVTSVTAVTAAISALAIGAIGDKVGSKRTLLVSVIAVAGLAIPQAYVTSTTQLLIWRALHGVFLGGIQPSANSLLARRTSPERRGSVMGLAFGAQAGGMALGPTVGAAVSAAWGMPSAFLVTAALFAVLAVLIGRLVNGHPAPQTAASALALERERD